MKGKQKMKKVAFIMGAAVDLKFLKDGIEFLKERGIEVSVNALSAHRTHAAVNQWIKEIEEDGTEVIIAAAGKAAHLPGVIAAMTIKPVIGVPIKGSALDGMDALLSIVQMPKGIPVATVAIDGGLNAAVLAMQLLALKHDDVKQICINYRKELENEVLEANKAIVAEYNK